MGWLYNLLAPLLLMAKTKQGRNYPYLHASVYAGEHNGHHYVIENGGGDGYGIGTIDAKIMEKCYEMNAKFFVLSPPKDSQGRSTRYLVLQRAFACLGIYYIYNMRAVSCETFAMIMMNLEFVPLQTEVLRQDKRNDTELQIQHDKDMLKYKKFHDDLCNRIEMLPDGTVLTLKFYIDNAKKPSRPTALFVQMTDLYAAYLSLIHI